MLSNAVSAPHKLYHVSWSDVQESLHRPVLPSLSVDELIQSFAHTHRRTTSTYIDNPLFSATTISLFMRVSLLMSHAKKV